MIKAILVAMTCGNLIFSSGCEIESMSIENPVFNQDEIKIIKYGLNESFDIATWNIEHFPKDQSYTFPYLMQIIQMIDIDLIAVQEIDESSLFLRLIDSLEGYQGFVSSLPDYGQHMGIIYKSDMIALSNPEHLFTDDDWAFPRPPLATYVTVKDENKTVFDFILIILHLKAFDDAESKSRRQKACQQLKNYIDTYLLTAAEKDIIILGDFNDELDDPLQNNIFAIFLNDSTNYQFLTLPLTGEATYIDKFESTVDHLLITNDAKIEYNGGVTQVLKIDMEFPEYLNYISDHRPVLAQFFIF
jgi:endonuclease/exonuclease/phosphatase family metal-dependent hydrolase